MFQDCAQHPDQHFLDVELKGVTFEAGRRGAAKAWSGGRATVIRANKPTGGSIAVRFSKHEDPEASVRYFELSRYLSSNPVSTMVGTAWVDNGLQIGAERYPILKMDWVNGTSLDAHISKHFEAGGRASAMTDLAVTWRASCRSLTAVGISHGDIHAGNTLVCNGSRTPIELRLVDYDNVWLPGLHTPVREIGHPAFAHPRRSELPVGPNLDAVPNTLTYLSLIALAGDPTLWKFHRSDDRLLFDKTDLNDPSADIWKAILSSKDSMVSALATITIEWLRGPPERFASLELAIAAAATAAAAPHDPNVPREKVNVWPPIPDARRESVPSAPFRWAPKAAGPSPAQPQQPMTWPPQSNPAPAAGKQSWQGIRQGAPQGNFQPPAPPVPPAPAVPPGAQNQDQSAAVLIIAIFVLVIVVLAIVGAVA